MSGYFRLRLVCPVGALSRYRKSTNDRPKDLQQRLGFACHLHFPHDPTRVIHNADAGLLDRYVQSSKMVHAGLLLLMLEAVTTDLVSPSALKAQHPKSSAIHKLGWPITPSYR